jgi:hypothetical protein
MWWRKYGGSLGNQKKISGRIEMASLAKIKEMAVAAEKPQRIGEIFSIGENGGSTVYGIGGGGVMKPSGESGNPQAMKHRLAGCRRRNGGESLAKMKSSASLAQNIWRSMAGV